MPDKIPTIAMGNIVIERAVPRKPIFFVTVAGQALVIKGEGGNTSLQERAITIHWASKMMKNVNNKLVNTKVLTPEEIPHFMNAAQRKYPDPKSDERYWLDKATMVWTKMPLVRGLSDSYFYSDLHGRDAIPSKIKHLIVKFYDEGLWAELGKIVAVDIFNGNNDRFHSADGDWVNYGNVMFLEGGDTSVIGLDTFDPAASMSFGKKQTDEKKLERLKTLVDGGTRLRFARAGTASVGEVLAKNLKGVTTVTLLVTDPLTGDLSWTLTVTELKTLYSDQKNRNFTSAYVAGIEKGADELKHYLQNKVRRYREEGLGPRHRSGPIQPVNPLPQVRQGSHALVRPNAPVKPDGMPQGIWDQMVYLGWQI